MTYWRDIADQLTDEQCAELTRFEVFEWVDEPEKLLSLARWMAAETVAAAVFSDIPAPAGAASVDHWEHDGNGCWFRHFTCSDRQVGPVTITVHGFQHSDGTVQRWLSVQNCELDATQCRGLGAALVDSANELDVLSRT